ncbi:uncharacterized protein [Musca autumnalis]|uniref:uncharacterized protein n=1 Tax=Musca autumnalis TaxID=221902 RepID=UPI003CEAF821
MDACEELLQNSVIVEHIFQYLTLEEQIQCTEISKKLCDVITNSMWKKSYRHLSIHKTPFVCIINNSPRPGRADDDVEETNEERLEKLLQIKSPLPYDKSKGFLAKVATYVEHLNLYSEYLTFRKNLGVAFSNVEIYTNLRSLSFNNLVVTDEQLELLAVRCVNLCKLEFIECQCDELESLVPGYNLDIKILAKMYQLRELVILCDLMTPSGQPELEGDVLHEMINNLNLSCLILRNIKIVNKCGGLVPLNNGCRVRTLNVGNISHEYWPDFKHQLKRYRNLVDLRINILDNNILLSSVVFQILSFSCEKLEKLCLEYCHLHVDDFSTIRTLQHLHLFSCNGFTAANLQQVLGGLHLKSLKLIETRIVGVIEDLSVNSSALETITIDAFHIGNIEEVFRDSIHNMENVSSIKWLSDDIKDDWILTKCPNLKRLHIVNPYTMRRFILKLDALQHLTFTSFKGMTWPFFLILLKNLPLKSLNICTNESIDYCKTEAIPYVLTKLRRILLPFHIFKEHYSFWLDLLTFNDHLRAVVYGKEEEIMNKQLLKDLLECSPIKDVLRYIKICGMQIDIVRLQTLFTDTFQFLKNATSHYRTRNSLFTLEL